MLRKVIAPLLGLESIPLQFRIENRPGVASGDEVIERSLEDGVDRADRQ